MRICQYNVALDDTGRSTLVKESSQNYPALDRLNSPGKVDQVMRDAFRLHARAEEYLYLVCTNTKGRPVGFFEIAHGTCHTMLVSPREIFVRALLCGASAILVIHNHPSGDPAPSREDNALTQRMREVADLIGIAFDDHVIIGSDTYYSYMEAGKLKREGV